ncbi:MAG: formylmethanofuran dehydrogenase subunit E family protein [Candidatus Omnitrophota bacterium]
MKINLKEAIKFHGHLGPYLVLGLLAGETALKKLKSKKYFGLKVSVWGANKKPKSCLVDGLQLSTGATYGKGNIHKYNSRIIKILFFDKNRNRRLTIALKKDLIFKLNTLKGHRDSEAFAKKLYNLKPLKVFDLQSIT